MMKRFECLLLTGLIAATVWSTGTSASAREYRETVGSLVAQIARSTDLALVHLQNDLIRRERWKPRGYDGKLWSALAKLEKSGDALENLYRHGRDPNQIGEVTRVMTKQLAGLHYWERMTYVPPLVHRDIRRLERAVALLDRWANGSPRSDYRSDDRSDQHYERGFEEEGDPWHRDGRAGGREGRRYPVSRR